MILVRHRVNKISELKKVPRQYGVEVDVRAYGPKLILNHEAFLPGDELDRYLANYNHKFIIFNVKEAGIENQIHKLSDKYSITDYFLLDCEFSYIYKASRAGEKRIAIRYSEDESLETALKYKNKVDWVWIDTNTTLPLDKTVVDRLKYFKTAVVCPERWGRPQDISVYINKMRKLRFKPDIVMTSRPYIHIYENAKI